MGLFKGMKDLSNLTKQAKDAEFEAQKAKILGS